MSILKFIFSVDWAQVAAALGGVVAAVTGLIRVFHGAKEKTLKNGVPK
jgi:hypothetical protein